MRKIFSNFVCFSESPTLRLKIEINKTCEVTIFIVKHQQILETTLMYMIFFTRRQFRNKYKKNGTAFTISQYLERNGLEEECMSWLLAFYPDEGMAEKKSNSRTHVEYIQHCR